MHFYVLLAASLTGCAPTSFEKSHTRVSIFHQWHSHFQQSSLPAHCPNRGSLQFEVGGLPRRIPALDRADAGGMVGNVFRTEDQLLAVKIGQPAIHPENVRCVLDMQNRDRAALAALSGLNVAPEVYLPELDSFRPTISAQCLASLIVMDWKRSGTDMFQLVVGAADILLIAQAAVEKLKKIHDAGLLHGDVHLGNMMVSTTPDGKIDPSSLWFIDFGRAMPFVDSFLNPLPASQMKAVTYPPMEALMDKLGLSVNELLGLPMTPNDDLFRLAESLVRLAIGPKVYVAAIRAHGGSIADFKKSFQCRGYMEIPPQVCTLYENTRAAQFADPPMYTPFL